MATKKKKKKKQYLYRLDVSVDLSYMDFSEVDTKMLAITKLDSGSSGCGFGERDHSYYFEHSKPAFNLMKKIRAGFKRDLVSVSITWDNPKHNSY